MLPPFLFCVTVTQAHAPDKCSSSHISSACCSRQNILQDTPVCLYISFRYGCYQIKHLLTGTNNIHKNFLSQVITIISNSIWDFRLSQQFLRIQVVWDTTLLHCVRSCLIFQINILPWSYVSRSHELLDPRFLEMSGTTQPKQHNTPPYKKPQGYISWIRSTILHKIFTTSKTSSSSGWCVCFGESLQKYSWLHVFNTTQISLLFFWYRLIKHKRI